MIPVSVIIPVYNEVFFLDNILHSLSPVVKEIILVDGGRRGCSTDGLTGLVATFDNVLLTQGALAGWFITEDGHWDKQTQMQAGLDLATTDIVLTFSADRIPVGIASIGDVVDSWDGEPYEGLARCTEFWMDSKHLKSVASLDDNRVFSTPPIVFAPRAEVKVNPQGAFYVHEASREVREDMKFYHFGWLRPFAEQVQKHIDHCVEGLMGIYSEQVLPQGYRVTESWAIHHTLSYRREDGIKYVADWPQELRTFEDMNYMDGYDEYVREYEERYEIGFYDGVLNTCPSVE